MTLTPFRISAFKAFGKGPILTDVADRGELRVFEIDRYRCCAHPYRQL